MIQLHLDLHRVKLYGWEGYKSKRVIDSILRGIEAGDVFDPITVCRKSELEYILDDNFVDPRQGCIDGGHHRAFAHYLARRPLPVRVSGEKLSIIRGYFPISEITIVSIEQEEAFAKEFGYSIVDLSLLKKDPRYR